MGPIVGATMARADVALSLIPVPDALCALFDARLFRPRLGVLGASALPSSAIAALAVMGSPESAKPMDFFAAPLSGDLPRPPCPCPALARLLRGGDMGTSRRSMFIQPLLPVYVPSPRFGVPMRLLRAPVPGVDGSEPNPGTGLLARDRPVAISIRISADLFMDTPRDIFPRRPGDSAEDGSGAAPPADAAAAAAIAASASFIACSRRCTRRASWSSSSSSPSSCPSLRSPIPASASDGSPLIDAPPTLPLLCCGPTADPCGPNGPTDTTPASTVTVAPAIRDSAFSAAIDGWRVNPPRTLVSVNSGRWLA